MQAFKKIGIYKKKLLALIVLAILLLYLLSSCFSLLAGSGRIFLSDRNRSTIGVQCEPRESLDVLFIGDSLNYCSFSPLQLWNDAGITSYVCGQSGQRMQESYYLLKTALKRQKPKVVVIESAVLFRSQEGIQGIKTGLGEMKNYYFPILRYHDIWKNLIPMQREITTDYKGYELRSYVAPYTGGEYMIEKPEPIGITKLVAAYFDKILRLCKKHNVEVMLVSVPSQATYNLTRHNIVDDFAQKRNLDYIDMNMLNDIVGIDWTKDTVDCGEHLNLYGAEKVTSFLCNKLLEYGCFESHKSDPFYHSWEEMNQRYQQERKKLKQ